MLPVHWSLFSLAPHSWTEPAERVLVAAHCAGASLVQLYSALVFHGPGLAQRILRGLAEALQRDGFASVAAAVGTED